MHTWNFLDFTVKKHSPMSNVQAVYLIIVDPHPQEDIKAFSVVVLTSEPGSRAHYHPWPERLDTVQ